MFRKPKDSPWGAVDYCDALCPGVYLVYTANQGGAMVAREIEEFLSPAARKRGERKNGFLCFGEDSGEEIVLRELLDKKLWAIPDRIRDKAAFEENIDTVLRESQPEYWRSREKGREHAPPVIPALVHYER